MLIKSRIQTCTWHLLLILQASRIYGTCCYSAHIQDPQKLYLTHVHYHNHHRLPHTYQAVRVQIPRQIGSHVKHGEQIERREKSVGDREEDTSPTKNGHEPSVLSPMAG